MSYRQEKISVKVVSDVFVHGSFNCSSTDDTLTVVHVWRHILMDWASTCTRTLMQQPPMHKDR